jgi:class 3 adenylate cyclase
MSAALFLKDPAAARYAAGGLAEAEELFGAPLPDLPEPELDLGREVFLVHVHSRLRLLQQRFLEGQLGQIGALTLRTGDPARDFAEYEEALVRVVTSVRQSDRRQGLLNLFWMAHSLDAAEHLHSLEVRSQSLRRGKQSLFPLLQSFYRRIDQDCRRARGAEGVGAFNESPALAASIIDDGFAFTEVSAANLDLGPFLASNKRYRIAPEVFFEMQQVLVREAERRLREGDRGLLSRVARHMPLLPREHYLKPTSLVRIVLSQPVQAYLLGDAWATGPRLTGSPAIKAELERRRGAEILDAFLELSVALRRFEIVSHLRDRIESLGAERSLELEEKTRLGLRVYEFGEAAQVINNAVAATVLFLDLRGFTRTSEGHISEGDLTRELYAVFDDFVPIVERFGGTVDKYLGDGMMVTWGTQRADPLDPHYALRTAVLCQESLRLKRESGRTFFTMGVAIHYGRVYLARFIASHGQLHSTVIGRNVNLAGRLSSAAKRGIEEDEVQGMPVARRQRAPLAVSVDAQGALFNEGIALSRDAVSQLEAHLALTHGEGGAMEYDDEAVGRRIQIRYAGDARFKGVSASLPVYDASHTERA